MSTSAPTPSSTLSLHDALPIYKVKATFFVLGATAEKYPETVQATATAGHEIAGMGYSFASIRTASEEQERANVRRSAKVLERSEEHTSELQSLRHLVCRLLLEK